MNLFYSSHKLTFFTKVNDNEFQTFFAFKINSIDHPAIELINKCIDAIQNELIININLAKIFISDTPYSIIPDQLFDKNNLEVLLSSTREKQNNDLSKSSTLSNLNLKLLYDLPIHINDYCQEKNIELNHWLAPFLNNISENSNIDNGIIAVFIENTISIIAFKDGKLIFLNDFNFQESLDALYYIMLVYNELHFNPEQIVLTVFGHISAESDIANQLKRYITNIKFSEQSYIGEPALNYYNYLLKL